MAPGTSLDLPAGLTARKNKRPEHPEAVAGALGEFSDAYRVIDPSTHHGREEKFKDPLTRARGCAIISGLDHCGLDQ